MAEKTEKATPKKLREARKKGQVAKSQDFPAAFTFATALFLLLTLGGYLFDQLGEFMVAMFRAGTEADIVRSLPTISRKLLLLLLTASLPFLGLISLIGVIVNFLIVGPTWASEAMKIDFKKLNPITGLKNKFKMKTLVELIKSLAKIGIATYLILQVVWQAVQPIIQTAALPVIATTYVVAEFLKQVAIRVSIFFLAVGVFDLIYQRRQFAKEMKMEKFEVKQEHKDLEGDPQIKGRRRELAREIAYQEGPGAVRRARAVVTNPTHIAVGIGYDEEKYAAPWIVVMGMGATAEQIMKMAENFGVPIMRNVELARFLFEHGQVNRFVPDECYEAVAEVLRWVIGLEAELEL